MEKEGVVSIWLSQTVYGDLDKAMKMCGVEYYDLDFVECAGDDDESLIGVTELIRRLSYSDSFRESAIFRARQFGIGVARRAIAYYDFAFDAATSDSFSPDAPVFVGVFEFK